jgi:hypothetical protein
VVALAAKSVARFPSLSRHEEGFAEYFLIGSLCSLVVALVVERVVAMITRIGLGFPPI